MSLWLKYRNDRRFCSDGGNIRSRQSLFLAVTWTHHETRGKCLILSVLRFPHLQSGANATYLPPRDVEKLRSLIFVKCFEIIKLL